MLFPCYGWAFKVNQQILNATDMIFTHLALQGFVPHLKQRIAFFFVCWVCNAVWPAGLLKGNECSKLANISFESPAPPAFSHLMTWWCGQILFRKDPKLQNTQKKLYIHLGEHFSCCRVCVSDKEGKVDSETLALLRSGLFGYMCLWRAEASLWSL